LLGFWYHSKVLRKCSRIEPKSKHLMHFVWFNQSKGKLNIESKSQFLIPIGNVELFIWRAAPQIWCHLVGFYRLTPGTLLDYFEDHRSQTPPLNNWVSIQRSIRCLNDKSSKGENEFLLVFEDFCIRW
jgi:hypothetical protein